MMIAIHRIRTGLYCIALLLAFLPPMAMAAADSDRFKSIYATEWDFRLREFPLFASYAGQGFTVKREVGDPGDRYKMVMTEIQPGDGKPPVKLDWQVKVNGDSYAVVDIRVEGASMAITQREEFTSVLEKNGGDIADLLDQLRTKVAKLRAERSNSRYFSMRLRLTPKRRRPAPPPGHPYHTMSLGGRVGERAGAATPI